MEQCKLSKTSNGENLGEVDVKRKIFHHFCLFEYGTFVVDT